MSEAPTSTTGVDIDGTTSNVGGSDHDGSVGSCPAVSDPEENPMTFQTADVISLGEVDGVPPLVTVNGRSYAPISLHIRPDGSVGMVAAPSTAGRVFWDEEVVVTAPLGEQWVSDLIRADAGQHTPTKPGTYVEVRYRYMIFPVTYSLSIHGQWYSKGDLIDIGDLPRHLIERGT